jgi:hypothetical protein
LAGALAKALADGRLDAARVEASLDRLDRLRSALG